MTERREFPQVAVDAKILVPKGNQRIQVISEDPVIEYGYVARHVFNSDGTYLWFEVKNLTECTVDGKGAYFLPKNVAGEVFEINEDGRYLSTIREAEAMLLPMEQFEVYDYHAPSLGTIIYLAVRLVQKKAKGALSKSNPLRPQTKLSRKK